MSTGTGSSGNVFTSTSKYSSLDERLAAMRAAASAQKTTSNAQKTTSNAQNTTENSRKTTASTGGNTSSTSRSLQERLAAMQAAANLQTGGLQGGTKATDLPTSRQTAQLVGAASLRDAAKLAADNLSPAKSLSLTDRLSSVESGIQELEQELAGYHAAWDVSPYTEEEQAYRDARASGLEQQLKQLKNTKAQLQSEVYEADRAEQVQALEAASQNEDFQAVVDQAIQGGGIWESGVNSKKPVYNDLRSAMNYIKSAARGDESLAAAASSGADIALEYMSDEQKNIIAYYVGKGDLDSAASYLENIAPSLNAKSAENTSAALQGWAREHPVQGAVTNAFSWPLNIPAYVENARQAAANAITGEYKPVDYHSGAFMGAQINNDLSAGVQEAARQSAVETFGNETAGDVAAFLAGTALSIGQNVTQVAVLGPYSLAGMAISAAGSATVEALERGATSQQAFLIGTANGAIEAITEKIPLDNLLSIAEEGGEGVVKNLLKQMFTEASEEAISEIADNLVDTAVLGSKSEYSVYVQELMAAGLSEDEAKKQAFLQFYIYNVLSAAAGGALSGGVMAGGASLFYEAGQLSSQLQNSQADAAIDQTDTAIDQAYRAMLDKGMFSQEAGAAGSQAADTLAATRETDDAWAAVRAQMEAEYAATQEREAETGLTPISEQMQESLSTGKNNVIAKTIDDIVSFVKNVRSKKGGSERLYMGTMPESASTFVKSSTGVDVTGYTAILPGSSVQHIFNRHGNVQTEAARGQQAVTAEDIALIPQVLSAPDSVTLSEETDAMGRPVLLFSKQIGDTYITAQAVTDGRKVLTTNTLWIQKKKNPLVTTSDAGVSAGPAHNVQNVPPSGSSTATVPQGGGEVNYAEALQRAGASAETAEMAANLLERAAQGMELTAAQTDLIAAVPGGEALLDQLQTAQEGFSGREGPGSGETESSGQRAAETPAGAKIAADAAELLNGGTSDGRSEQSATAVQGNNLSDGGQRRVSGAGTGEQTGSLVQGTSGRGQAAQQSRTAIERQNRVRNLQLEKVSSKSLGIRNGTDVAALTVVPENAWDDGMRQTAQRVREETGKAVTFVVGGIQVSTAAGVRMARGVYSQDGIIIQADNLRYTTDQIADHEIYHDRTFQTPGMNWEIEQRIQARFGQDEFGQTVETYIKYLRGVLDTEGLAETDGAALDELLEAVKEEIFADAYAGINAFSANATKYADTVNEVMSERGVGRSRQSDAATARRTGPPESIGTASHLQGEQSRDTIDTAKYSLEGELQDGRAREEDREAFLRRIDSEGLTAFEGDAIAYGYRDVQGSGSASAEQVQEELTRLGIDCAIMDGSLSWNLNGITGQRSVTEATAVEGKRVLINGNTTIAAKNAAGHEAFHFWKNTSARDAYIETLEDNLDYTSEAFLTYQSAIAEAYLGGEANLSDSGQYKKLREELFAYISGDIYEGTNDEYLRLMFRNFDEVKAAWGSMVNTARAGGTADGGLELPNVWADGQNSAAESNSEVTGELDLPYVDNSGLDGRQRFSVEDEPDAQFQRVEPLGQENEGQDADWADYTQDEVRELTARGYTSAQDYMMRAPDADREAGKVRAVRKLGESSLQDFDNVDDYTRYLDERAAQAKEARLRQIPKEEFAGSESLKKLGIRIEHSEGDYSQVKQLIANDKAARQIRKETGRARKRLGATRAEENFASGIAEGIYTVDDIPQTMNRDAVEELADYYFAERAAGQDLIREKRNTINAAIDEKVQDIFKDSDKFKVPSGLVLNNRTAQRNMRSIFGAERGSEINAYLFDPVQTNEAERLRFVNRMYDEVREFEGKDGRKKALNKTERELVQKVIEGQVDVNEQLKGEKVDEVRIRNAAAKYSELFDQFYDAINDFLVAHGYEPIGYIKGYAPHLQPESSQSALTKALQAMGIGTDVTTLPSSIAGLTAEFKPSKKWNPYFLTRTGAETQYDIAAAFESYVDYMSDVIYHTDDIMRLRRAAGYFRKTYAPDDIRSKIEWAEDQRKGTTEQKESVLRTNDRIGNDSLLSAKDIDQELDKYIEELYRDTENVTKYSNLVMYLDNYTNILAGKQNMMDRGWETGVGRKVLNLGNKIMSVFGQAQIAGNLSSAINQISQLPMVQAEVGPRYVLQAATDIAFGKTKKADWANEVDFLVGKQGVDPLVNDKLSDKIIEGMFKPVEIADQLMSTVTVRAKYLQQISQGKTHQEAIKAADAFGRSIMGDRTKGARPVAFTAKNPLSRMLRVFQLEALNTVEHFTQDLPDEIVTIKKSQGAGEAAKRLAAIVIRYLLAAFLLNRITEQINGSTPATLDIIGLGTGFVASGKGTTTNNLLATMIDNGLEDMGAERIFGTDADSLSGGFDLKSALEETGYNVSNDIPFVRNAAGIMGWGDESLPTLDLPGIAESAQGIPEAIADGDGWGVADGIIGVLSQLLPGGRQLQKTYNGLRLEAAGGSYNASGNLKYPVDGNAMEILQAALFGSSALEETDEYYASGNNALNKTQTELYKNLVNEGMDRKDAFEMVSSIRDMYTSLNSDESLTATEKATAFARWVDQTYDGELAERIKDQLKFYSMVPAEASRYQSMTEEGVDADAAYALAGALTDLEPAEGSDSVTNLQRMWEIAESPYGEDVQELALKTVMSESAYTRYMAARNAGVGTLDYVKVYEAIRDATMERRGSSGSPSQADVETALNRSGLTSKQKKAIWDSYGWKSESPWG